MAKKKTAKKSETQVSGVEDSLTKRFGDGVIVSSDFITTRKRVIVPISPNIDMMTGGGVPFGSFTILTGPPKTGKTSLALQIAANALKIPNTFKGVERKVYFFDIEARLNKRDIEGIQDLLDILTKDPTRFIRVGSTETKTMGAEDFLEAGEQLIKECPGSIFIFDSFSQLCSAKGMMKDWADGKEYRDNVPKLLSHFCKRVCNDIPIRQSLVIGITHRIADTGMSFSPWAEASGTKVQYAVDLKLNCTHFKNWMEEDAKVGQEVYWKCACSPLLNGSANTECASRLRYGYGIDRETEIIDMAVDLGLIEAAGSWYTLPNVDDKVQGKPKVRQYFMDNPQFYDTVNTEFRETMGLPSVGI